MFTESISRSLPAAFASRIQIVPLSVGMTYVAVLVGAVFFRSSSLHDVGCVLADMAERHGLGQVWPLGQGLLIAAQLAVVWLMPNTQEILGG